MDAITAATPTNDRAIEFSGSMREYLPIAATNALLTLATLFVYRSWAKARDRRYLWSRTRFIDDELEWTGTGKEMFFGFLMAALLLGVGAMVFRFGLPALITREGALPALIALPVVYVVGFYLYALARFRGLRYRLSRTWWRGIRGGGNDGGWNYARKAVGYNFATFFLAGFLYPWAQAKLWNERWNKMSFGPEPFVADMTSNDTKGAFIFLWFAFVIGNIVLKLFFNNPYVEVYGPGYPRIVVPLIIYSSIAVTYLYYLTAYYQAVADLTRIGDLEFRFTAEFEDWFKFYAATVGLAIITLGAAMFVYNYRKWKFMTLHLEVFGTIDVDALTQSTTTAPREAEGFLDALDIGAF